MAATQSSSPDDPASDTDKICPVCLQTFVYPSRLPCSHVFCFLCIKGVVNKNNRCAMCRTPIPDDYLNNPVLVAALDEELSNKSSDFNHHRQQHSQQYQWFYEGRNGFWQYDLRTSQELEEAHTKGEKTCTILVAGFLYVVDFEKMYQFRQNDASRRRKVKREKNGPETNIPMKGVAGIRIHTDDGDLPTTVAVEEGDTDSSVEIVENEVSVIDVSDEDDGVTPLVGRRHNSQVDLIDMFSDTLVLGEDVAAEQRTREENV